MFIELNKYLNLRIKLNLSNTFRSGDLYFNKYTVSSNCKSKTAFKINTFDFDKLEVVFVNIICLFKN